jgi:choline dehydrogenase-like flavoprotein
VTGRAIVVGSGIAGGTAAMVLAEAGWQVVMFEKGANHFGDLTAQRPRTLYANDELKSLYRFFGAADPLVDPRTFRRHSSETRPRVVGLVNTLPTTVGGGTVFWDAKVPRFWDIDFAKRSALGPVPGADVDDWPFGYAELAPWYARAEALLGVQGDLDQLPAHPTLAHAPRDGPFTMPPGPAQHGSLLAAAGARRVGLHPFPFPMAINSVDHDGRPACNDCGMCSGYGCPILARAGALAPLGRALRTGRVDLRAQSFVHRVDRRGTRATGVSYLNAGGRPGFEPADLVVLAASAIETVRLALLSRFPDPHGLLGRHLMFHWFTDGSGVFLDRRIHANRGRSTTHAAEDFADPDYPGARQAAAAAGLPYLRGGLLELGGSQEPISEALAYKRLLPLLAPDKPFGAAFKQLMRASVLRDRLLGVTMVGEDLPQPTNRVDLDPSVRDAYHVPVARITYSPHRHELAAQRFYRPLLVRLLKAAGADAALAVPATSSDSTVGGEADTPTGMHIMGGMRMGTDPRRSVCDPYGAVRGIDNVVVADASVFVTSGAANPTLTLMATALRNVTHQVHPADP